MADEKLTQLVGVTLPLVTSDLFYVVQDVSTTPVSRKITFQDLSGQITPPAGGGGLTLVQSQVLSGDVATITFSGLDGDTDRNYLLEFFLECSTAVSGIFVRPNGVTSNLSDARFFAGGNDSSASEWELYHQGGSNAARITGSMTIFAAKSIHGVARNRFSNFTIVQEIGGSFLAIVGAGFWNESTTNMTSLVIFTNQPTGIKDGSFANLYKYAQS